MTTPVIAAFRAVKQNPSISTWPGPMLKKLFEIAWIYDINQTEALHDYGTKAEAYKAFKRGISR